MKYRLPLATPAPVNAEAMRNALEESGLDFDTGSESVHYSRLVVVVPTPGFAYAFTYEVKEPHHFKIFIYDTNPTHGNSIFHFVEIRPWEENIPVDFFREIMRTFTDKLPVKPWEFDWRERLRTGWLLPEFRKSKKLWETVLGKTP